MMPISQEQLRRLLETDDIPGSPEQLLKLRIRIGELLEMNGECWVRENRKTLLEEWTVLLEKGRVR